MSDSSSIMSTAAQVWRRLVQDRVLLPKSYDEDVADLLNGQLPGVGSLTARMDVADWTARDLLRAMLPVVDSFAELTRDLFSLYSGIVATQATKENIVVSYEFDEQDVFDQSLEQFRSAVSTLNQAQAAQGSFVYSPMLWRFPWGDTSSFGNEVSALRDGGRNEWGFTLPAPPDAKDPAVARGVSLVYAVLTAACETLRTYGGTMHLVHNNPALLDTGSAELGWHGQLYFDFTDFFPEAVIVGLRREVARLASQPPTVVASWLRDVESWCESFWAAGTGDAESALESVLSLPMWGKRHELYSAWVVCLIAEAFKDRDMQFKVVDGKLAFPFRGTQIATFKDRGGLVGFWSEVRSAASGELGHGRKNGVQPDYRFLRPGQPTSDAEMAVEVKQYRRAAASRHGITARDYAQALPEAQVTIVAHGPIGATALDRVALNDQTRVSFRDNVRRLDSTESKAFIEELTAVFPSPSHVQAVEVVSARVNEVEVRLMAPESEPSAGRVVHRGARVQGLGPTSAAEVVIAIVCHPERAHTIDHALVRVAVTDSEGVTRVFEAVPPISSTVWHLGTLGAGKLSLSAATVEIEESPRSGRSLTG